MIIPIPEPITLLRICVAFFLTLSVLSSRLQCNLNKNIPPSHYPNSSSLSSPSCLLLCIRLCGFSSICPLRSFNDACAYVWRFRLYWPWPTLHMEQYYTWYYNCYYGWTRFVEHKTSIEFALGSKHLRKYEICGACIVYLLRLERRDFAWSCFAFGWPIHLFLPFQK